MNGRGFFFIVLFFKVLDTLETLLLLLTALSDEIISDLLINKMGGGR